MVLKNYIVFYVSVGDEKRENHRKRMSERKPKPFEIYIKED